MISIRLHRIYIPRDLITNPLVLADENAHYLSNVLRVQKGAMVETFDGRGGIDRWSVLDKQPKKVVLEHSAHERKSANRPVNLRLGLNPLKGANEETAIRMAASMEVMEIIPVFFFRSDIPLDDDKMESRINRWKRLTRSEVAVSGGAFLPEIGGPVTFDEFIINISKGILFYENAEPGAESVRFKPGEDVTVMVGPEGGLEKWEVEAAVERGLTIAGMGPWILRAELAAVFAPHWIYSRVERRLNHGSGK